jgi:hypothetical protein
MTPSLVLLRPSTIYERDILLAYDRSYDALLSGQTAALSAFFCFRLPSYPSSTSIHGIIAIFGAFMRYMARIPINQMAAID